VIQDKQFAANGALIFDDEVTRVNLVTLLQLMVLRGL
jgi:hypothetical protein